MSIFMRGFIRVNKELERKSYVCDSFRGLPPSTLAAEKNISWDNTPYLEVSDDKVRRNFQTLGLSDPNVVFVKGFFSDSLRELKNIKGNGGKFALLRLDGDMYESTMVGENEIAYHCALSYHESICCAGCFVQFV